eukprot:gene7116-biopygen26991
MRGGAGVGEGGRTSPEAQVEFLPGVGTYVERRKHDAIFAFVFHATHAGFHSQSWQHSALSLVFLYTFSLSDFLRQTPLSTFPHAPPGGGFAA